MNAVGPFFPGSKQTRKKIIRKDALLNYLHTRIAPSFPASTFLDPFVMLQAIFRSLARALMRSFQQRITYWRLTNRFGLSVLTFSLSPHFLAYKTLQNFHRHLWGLFLFLNLPYAHCSAAPSPFSLFTR